MKVEVITDTASSQYENVNKLEIADGAVNIQTDFESVNISLADIKNLIAVPTLAVEDAGSVEAGEEGIV